MLCVLNPLISCVVCTESSHQLCCVVTARCVYRNIISCVVCSYICVVTTVVCFTAVLYVITAVVTAVLCCYNHVACFYRQAVLCVVTSVLCVIMAVLCIITAVLFVVTAVGVAGHDPAPSRPARRPACLFLLPWRWGRRTGRTQQVGCLWHTALLCNTLLAHAAHFCLILSFLPTSK